MDCMKNDKKEKTANPDDAEDDEESSRSIEQSNEKND